MKITLDLPDELAADLQVFEKQSAGIVAAGLREIKAADGAKYHGMAQFFEKLVELPSPEEVLVLRPSPELDARIRELLRKHREEFLTDDEEAEWQRYEMLEHFVRVAKARARGRMEAASSRE